MMVLNRSRDFSPRHAVVHLVGCLLISAVPVTASAEIELDPIMVDLVVESRLQKPAEQATPSERANAEQELRNIYAISDLPRAQELAKDPLLNAQIELSRRAMVFQAFAADFVKSNPATDQEIFDLYQEQVALAPPQEYKARHILVETQGQAADLIGQLDSGASFEELAKSHSTGPSGPTGGDLGWFSAQGMVKPFSDAVAALEDGTYTKQAIQTQFGWHVILREDSRELAPPPLESVRDAIKQRVEQDKFQTFMLGLQE